MKSIIYGFFLAVAASLLVISIFGEADERMLSLWENNATNVIRIASLFFFLLWAFFTGVTAVIRWSRRRKYSV